MANTSLFTISWTKGYQGSSCHFVNETTICYRINNIIKFVSFDGKEKSFRVPGDGVGPIATNPLREIFAYVENSIAPSIFIFTYPDFNKSIELKDGAKLEYLKIQFSTSIYLASISGIPDYRLIIWRYTDGLKLIIHEFDNFLPKCIQFNPGDWRQIALASKTQLIVYNVEQSNTMYIVKKIADVRPLPEQFIPWETKKIRRKFGEEHSDYQHEYSNRECSRFSYIKVPLSAICGLKDEDLASFEEYLDKTPRLVPVSLCWTLKGSILVGCEDGQLFKVDLNSMTIKRLPINNFTTQNESNELIEITLKQGSVDQMRLHKNGIYTSGSDGCIYILSIGQDNHVTIQDYKNFNQTILTMSFSPSHKNFVIGTTEGLVFLFPSNDLSNPTNIISDYSSRIIALRAMNLKQISCVTLKDSGYLQTWDSTGKNLSYIFMNKYDKACSMVVSSTSQIAAVGSVNGMLYIVNLNRQTQQQLNIVYSIRLHRGPIFCLKFGLQSRFLLTGSNDGNLMVNDGSPSYKFVTYGPIKLEGKILAITMLNSDDYVAAFVLSEDKQNLQHSRLSYFHLPFILRDVELKDFFENKKCEFPLNLIHFKTFIIPDFCVDLTISSDANIYVLANTKNIYVYKYNPDETPDENKDGKDKLLIVPSKKLKLGVLFRRAYSGIIKRQVEKKESIVHLDDTLTPFTFKSFYRGDKHAMSRYSSEPTEVDEMDSILSELVNAQEKSQELDLEIDNAQEKANELDPLKKLIEKAEVKSVSSKGSSNYYNIPQEEYVSPIAIYEGHKLFGGCIRISFHQEWLITGGGDGRICIRNIKDMSIITSFTAHSMWSNGVYMCEFSNDCNFLYSTGFQGLLYCYTWNLKTLPKNFLESAIRYSRDKQRTNETRQLNEHKALIVIRPINFAPISVPHQKDMEAEIIAGIDAAVAANEIYVQPQPAPLIDATWSEMREAEFLKDEEKKYAPVKTSIRQQLKTLRKKLKLMIKENEQAPDIEKLAHSEFDLDIEKQMRLQAQGEEEIDEMRREKELSNISKQFLANVIKSECWDAMHVKGRAISGFKSDLDVHNYPMMERSAAEIELLVATEALRKIETAELKFRKELLDYLSPAQSILSMNDEESADSLDNPSDNLLTSGTYAIHFGGGNEYLYNQFELVTRDQKFNQIVLLKDSIHKMKESFNKRFIEVFDRKEQDILKVIEKNHRLRKILHDIGREEEVVLDPQMSIKEKPEMLFITHDDEVKVERYLTAEQQAKLMEEKAAEEERIRREKRDDWRGRGLTQMMGGVLEIKREDELKMDIPLPAFMAEKTFEQWNEEERKLAEEYKKQVKELEEEREKYKKVLEGELAKLHEQINEIYLNFDEAHKTLFKLKINTESAIYQETLMILRLRYSMLLEEQLKEEEKELNIQLDGAKYQAHQSINAHAHAVHMMEEFKTEYEMHVAEDKLHEKLFKKEFHDQPNFVIETLFKLYKKRPRTLKGLLPSMPAYSSTSENAFSERPSTATREEDARVSFLNAMLELDDYVNIPDGVDRTIWIRLCKYRQEKVSRELQLKQDALTLAEMNAFVSRRKEEEESKKMAIDVIINHMHKLRNDKHLFYTNLEVQLLLKQGQVEVDVGPDEFVTNHTNSILLHREVIIELNKKIKALGESKIDSMIENKDFKKGIMQLEWEYKKMEMEMEDLKNQLKDVASFKVTREVQRFLSEKNYNESKNMEIMMVEKSILAHLANHDREVESKQRTMEGLRKSIEQMKEKNASLMSQLERLNVAVLEKKHMKNFGTDEGSKNVGMSSSREERYADMLKRKRLLNVVRAQADEMQLLRSEVDRLRMRTFPALRRLGP